MFGIDGIEILVVAIAALIVIGPKDLPAVMRTIGRWLGKIRGMARHFTSGIESVMREAELEEMEKKWRAENERIMAEHPMTEFDSAEPPAAALPTGDPDQPGLPLEGGEGDTPPPGERDLK